ncbi:WG repeat-containing protein, partial [Aquimarina sp. MMG015]|uniref:WG repeat-containing protein n=1 Tax=Aquimarina sp. MMG015 TaxID=2822689 RepID=UPI001B3A3ECF
VTNLRKKLMRIIILLVTLFNFTLTFSQISEAEEISSSEHLNKYRTEGNNSLVKKNGKFGIYNEKLKSLIIPYDYANLTLFKTEDSVSVASYYSRSNKFLIDKNNKVISKEYTNFKGFNKKLNIAVGKEHLKDGIIEYNVIINTNGKEISQKHNLIYYNENLDVYIIQNKEGNYGILNSELKQIIPFIYESINIKNLKKESFIIAKKNGKYGTLNLKNKTIIPFKYESINVFSKNKFLIKQNGKAQIRDSSDKIILDTKYNDIKKPDINENHIVRNDFNYGLINNLGKLIIPTEYKNISNKKFGIYYYVSKNRLVGLFDSKGKIKIPIEYKYFKIVKPIKSSKITDVTRLIAKRNDNFGVIDLNNNIIIPFVYKSIKTIDRNILNKILKTTDNLNLKKQLADFLKEQIYEVTDIGEKTYWLNDDNNKIELKKN